MPRNRNLFLSHAWTYPNAYEKFCKLLDAAPRFSYRNYSIPKDNPVHNASNTQALCDAINERIQFCEIVIIMAGKYATYSKWIHREIRIARVDFNKPVLAVRPWSNTQVSTIVKDNADRLVNWSTSSIVDAIRELAP